MKAQPPAVAELLLEQLALGEIDPTDERWLRAQLEPAEIERRLAALREADERFSARHDAAKVLTSIAGRTRIMQARLTQEQSTQAKSAQLKSTLRFVLPSLAVAACALFFVAQPFTQTREPPSQAPQQAAGRDDKRANERHDKPELIYVKGLSPHLVLYRRRGEQAATLSDGARVGRGDMLQVGYVAAKAKHGVIVSVDGARAVTLHYPDAESAPTSLEAAGEQLLQHAYELDAAPAFERFYFVTSAAPIDVTQVLAAARALAGDPARARHGALALPARYAQHNLTLIKE